jgi:hypothetical protein
MGLRQRTGYMVMETDDLEAWIAELRNRLARGELAGLGSVDMGDDSVVLSGELLVRVTLADFDHYDDLVPERRHDGDVVARRLDLLRFLRRLRSTIG